MNLALLENQAGALGDAARLASSVEEQIGLPETVRASAAGIAGLSYESEGQGQEAIQHFKVAIRLDPAQERLYVALARIYAANEDRPASVDCRSAKAAGPVPKHIAGTRFRFAVRRAISGRQPGLGRPHTTLSRPARSVSKAGRSLPKYGRRHTRDRDPATTCAPQAE